MKRKRGVPVLLQAVLILATVLAGCTGGRGSVGQPPDAGATGGSAATGVTGGPAGAPSALVEPATGRGVDVNLNQTGTSPTGLQLRLSDGTAAAGAPVTATLATATSLPAAEIQAVLNRLPALQAPITQTTDFARPAASLPAPRPGKTVTETFPSAAPGPSAAAPTGGALTVLRHAPDGEVPLAPYLSATFSQPMVALTGIADLAAAASPVKLEPQVPGKWRWVGTQTLLFEPDAPATGAGPGRFPMATYYTATVPSATTAAGGSALAEAIRWTFSTPAAQLQSSSPNGGPQRRDAAMFAAFDQRIDPQALVKLVQVKAGGKTFAVRLLADDEVKADPVTKGLVERAETGRWLAFRSDEPFPADSDVTVTFPAGTPSAEGPRRTDKAQGFAFHTYGPLRVTQSRCGWSNTCPPTAPWFITFSNPLDPNAWQDAWVQVDPTVSGLKIGQAGNSLTLQGLTQGRTKYRVTLKAAIKDVFGQTLGADAQFTFDVGSADATLVSSGRGMVVLDPTAKPAYSVYSINIPRLKVRVQAVQPEDWPAWQTYLQNYYRQDNTAALPGKQVINQTINVQGKTDQLTETAVDLNPALTNGFGQLAVVIEPDPQPDPKRGRQVVMSWMQVTKIGLDAFADGERLVAWANALTDGGPLAGVEMVLYPASGAAPVRTGADGLAALNLPTGSGAALLVARQGQDTAVLPENEYYYGGESGWRTRPRQDELRWYVFDDRGIYRPGEDVRLKGWIRRIGAGASGDVGLAGDAVRLIRYQLIDPRGNQIGTGQVEPNALGGFNLTVTIPKDSNLGQAMLQFTAEGAGSLDGRTFGHGFQVQEFRRPEFEVKASAADGPFFVGGQGEATVNANYYAGGGLPNAEVTWRVQTQPGQFTPPNWGDFTFGLWVPWWGPLSFARPIPPGGNMQTFSGHTDASGAHHLRLDFDSVNPPQPTTVTAEGTVMDVNRQAWTASTSLLVHPASLYVGLRTARMFVEREQPLPVDIVVVDLDGNVVPGVKVSVRAARLDYAYKNGNWQEVETAVQPCTVTSAKDPVSCKFETPQGGAYRITATIADPQGRTNLTEITRWVSGGGRPPSRNVEQEEVTLVPDRKEYKTGDTAEILVQAPFSPAEGVVTLERNGIVSSQRFSMTGPSYTLKVPIVEGYIPAIDVAVDLVGAATRLTDAGQPDTSLPKRPAYAHGSLSLSVPPLARTLAVTATPRDKTVDPGATTTVDLLVKDAAGQPVKDAEVALVVVDEAVLALTDFKLDDPLGVFYTPRSGLVNDYHLRHAVTLANPTTLAAQAQTLQNAAGGVAPAAAAPMAAAPMATSSPAAAGARALADSASKAAAPPIALRTDFNALASFTPSVTTDAQGKANVEVKLPDNLTRYRVMAVAVAGGKLFGMGESAITGRLPLMVRPSPPRFLNFGDRFELPIVLQNQTDRPMTVTVALRAVNATLIRTNLERSDTAGYTVNVPANDRVEVRFPATTVKPGTASFQVGATAPAASNGQAGPADAAEFSLPVWTPATTEAFATYGTIDEGSIAQPVIAPTNVYTQFGGLEITTSSTALQALSDAVLYLTSYPYECSEQLASRVLAVAALRDVLTAFHADGLPSPDALQQSVNRDITRLRGLQNADGGWPVWQRGDESWPYYSVHVSHALARAKAKGFDVPQDTLDRAKQYLATIEQHIPSWYGETARRSLIAYALYVRKQLGDSDTAKARQLIDSGLQNVSQSGPENLSPEAVGWLLYVLSGDAGSQKQVTAIRQYLNNRVVETAGAANFVTNYGDDNYLLLASDRRADAVILEAMIQDQPKADLIPKIVAGLLAQRKAGRWNNTQENTFVLLALDRYFNTYEAQTPDFVARLWLGDTYAGEQTFKGRTTDRGQVDIPMSYVTAAGGAAQNLILSKDGPGRLYYRLGLKYAPTDLNLKPYDAGFTVERAYEAMDNPADVRQDKDGTWHIKAGATVQIRLTMVAHDRRYHVALTDPLPAGLEALNPALAVNAPPTPGPVVPLTGKSVGPVRPGGPVVAPSAPIASPMQAGGGLAVAPLSASRPVWSWWRWWTWYEHQNLRDDRAEAFTSLLWQGVYTYTYTARATTLGTFVVPPAKAEEMYAPETFGRSGTDRVIVE